MFCPKCGTESQDDSQFCRKCGQPVGASTGIVVAPAAAKARHFTTTRAILFLVLILVALVFFYSVGGQGVKQTIATVAHTPITLQDSVQNVPARSWRAVGLNAPYSGALTINLNVVQGNPVDVFLVKDDQMPALKNADWPNVHAFTDFNATKTRTYQRESQIAQGVYYLVLRDTSLGILSARASDISVKVQLNP
jgi:zinc-ribbon domain